MCEAEFWQETDGILERGDRELFSEASRVWGPHKQMVRHSKASDGGEPSTLLPLKGPSGGAAESGCGRLSATLPAFSERAQLLPVHWPARRVPGQSISWLLPLLMILSPAGLTAGQTQQKPENEGAQLGQSVEARLPGQGAEVEMAERAIPTNREHLEH